MRQSIKGRALRHFTFSTGKSAGRNSSGRITVFHRGGGSKRLQRKIDLKRSTSSIGIVERIEYDPNRSSRIALVRWIEGVLPGRQRKFKTIEEFALPRKILESTTATIFCLFSFSSLSSPLAQGETASLSFGSSFGFPRIAVAGAKPAFFAPRIREKKIGKKTFSLCEIRKWRTHCVLWAHRIKRKAALSWQSFRQQKTFELVGAAEHNESKLKADQGSLLPRQVLAYALCSGRPSYLHASRSFYKALLPVEASRFGSLPAKPPIGEGPKDGAYKVDRAPVVSPVGPKQCLSRSDPPRNSSPFRRQKNGTSISCGYPIPPLGCPADSGAFTNGRSPLLFEEQKARGIAGSTNVNECKLRCPNTIGADHTRCYRGSKRGPAATIERLSLSIPSHTGREVKWQSKRPYARVAPRGVLLTSKHLIGERGNAHEAPAKGRPARPYAHGCRILRKSAGSLGDLRPWLSYESRGESSSSFLRQRLMLWSANKSSLSFASPLIKKSSRHSISDLSSLQSFASCSWPSMPPFICLPPSSPECLLTFSLPPEATPEGSASGAGGQAFCQTPREPRLPLLESSVFLSFFIIAKFQKQRSTAPCPFDLHSQGLIRKVRKEAWRWEGRPLHYTERFLYQVISDSEAAYRRRDESPFDLMGKSIKKVRKGYRLTYPSTKGKASVRQLWILTRLRNGVFKYLPRLHLGRSQRKLARNLESRYQKRSPSKIKSKEVKERSSFSNNPVELEGEGFFELIYRGGLRPSLEEPYEAAHVRFGSRATAQGLRSTLIYLPVINWKRVIWKLIAIAPNLLKAASCDLPRMLIHTFGSKSLFAQLIKVGFKGAVSWQLLGHAPLLIDTRYWILIQKLEIAYHLQIYVWEHGYIIFNVIQVKAQSWLGPQELMLKLFRSQPHNVLCGYHRVFKNSLIPDAELLLVLFPIPTMVHVSFEKQDKAGGQADAPLFVVLQRIQWIILMEEVRGARKEVDLRCHLGGSPPKQDFGQLWGWGNAE
uniref:60S ribosomal protein L2, mitochondrial n=1 Tax=Oryza minuta TaxID=63629 RepID=A0A142D7X8_ORYMI|nr:ribosomal protein L2 [Oryza minuta]AMQ23378.1 ribosomal protein L2 [Oryza minuta]